MHKRTKLTTSLLVAFGGVLLSAGPVAQAQDAQKLERVTVTGSNIKRTDSETASPVQIITREEIEKSGKQTISDVIRTLPVDSNGSISTAFSAGFAAGASGVSLRGLGVQSTLVLVNGRRMAPYGLADDGQRNFVDLNQIPLDTVERIEVLKDGASAIYGSDAIAGVVNVILRKDYKGFQLSASGGATGYGDGENGRLAATAGFGDRSADGYNIFITAEASKQSAIAQSDRRDRKWIGTGDVRPYGYAIDGAGGLTGYWVTPGAITSYQVSGAVRNPTTLQYQLLPGCSAAGLSDPDANGGCVFDTTVWDQIQPKEQRYGVYARGTFDLSPTTELYSEVGLFKSEVDAMSPPGTVTGISYNVRDRVLISRTAVNNLPAGHPDNPFGAAARFRYAPQDLPRYYNLDTTSTRFLGGIRGTAMDWDYDLGALYVESKTDLARTGFIRASALNAALANGTFLIGAGRTPQSVLDQVSPTLTSSTKTSVTSVDLKVSRELMQLAGGAMGLALGFEARQEKLDSPDLPGTFTGDVIGLGYSSFAGDRKVYAAYAELAAPVTKSLELSAALRGDRYSDFGSSVTPKVGAKWKPVESFAVRGTYATGFRAPGPAENGNSSTVGFTTFVDPARCPGGVGAAADCGSGTAAAVTIGNPNIEPEKSRSITFGFIFEPTRDLSLAVDLWQITRKNEIFSTDPNLILANPSAFPGAEIIRDDSFATPTLPGRVIAVVGQYQNFSKVVTNGIDFDIRQRFNLGEAGRLTSNLVLSYFNKFERVAPDGTKTDYVGTHGPTSLSGNAGQPRTRASWAFGYDKGGFLAGLSVNYISGIRNVEFQYGGCLNGFADGSDAPGGCRIASFTTVDLSGKYNVSKQLEVFGSVLNLFDRIAPLDPQTYGAVNYNPTFQLSGAIGRQFNVGARYKF